jgi:uncharacterized delta-60 repeat protein
LPNGGILSLRHVDSSVRLHGWRNHWRIEAGSTPESDEPLFQNVTYKVDAARSGDTEGAVVSAPNREDTIPTIDVPVDEVMVGDDLNVRVTLTVAVLNRRQSESFAGATLRDLASGSGVRLEEQGLEVVRAQARQAPEPPPPALPLPAAACATGVDPAAGSIHLEMDSIDGFEQAGARALIRVVRSGGGKGAASVVFSTSDGTARAGVDYTPVTTVVRFDDGEQGGRLVTIPIADNAAPDGDRTVMLSLTQPMGCAALGAPSTATLVIHDDDTPAPATTAFHLGGTITGLAGSGLVLADVVNGSVVMPAADGAFVFPVTLIDGGSYDVGVQAQPQNPAQSCTVSRGHGKIAGADVTDIAVSCTTLPSNGALDPTFGAAGKVSASLAAPSAVALQPDGKILTVGDMTLSRFNADGSIDAAFGTAGSVTLVASGGPVDALVALSIQADGKIVVAGNTSLPTSINDNFVVARFDAAGRPDGTFGTTGQVVTDFNGLYDRATAVLVQPDQKTVAAGGATSGSLSAGDQDFALVRYLPGGDLDSTFGVGGKATLNVAGNADFGNTAALQADGKILVAGRVFANGSSSADIGVARVNADGTLDKAFGVAGVARVSFDGGTGDVAKLVVQPDGKIVIAGSSARGGVSCYAMVRLAIDGSLDAAFGTHGQVSTPFTTEQDYATSVALLADGRIVVAGELASYDKNSDMGLARYTSSGALDPSFGTGGLLRIDLFGDADGAYDLVVQPDGRIVAAGLGRNGPGGGLALVRVLP